MEQWQIEEIQALLETETKEVEPGKRVYTSSVSLGTDVYHLLDRLENGVQFEQVDINDKWSKWVKLLSDEIPMVLKTLLVWYLEDKKRQQEAADSSNFLGG